jgi:hypothetical protein
MPEDRERRRSSARRFGTGRDGKDTFGVLPSEGGTVQEGKLELPNGVLW